MGPILGPLIIGKIPKIYSVFSRRLLRGWIMCSVRGGWGTCPTCRRYCFETHKDIIKKINPGSKQWWKAGKGETIIINWNRWGSSWIYRRKKRKKEKITKRIKKTLKSAAWKDHGISVCGIFLTPATSTSSEFSIDPTFCKRLNWPRTFSPYFCLFFFWEYFFKMRTLFPELLYLTS